MKLLLLGITKQRNSPMGASTSEDKRKFTQRLVCCHKQMECWKLHEASCRQEATLPSQRGRFWKGLGEIFLPNQPVGPGHSFALWERSNTIYSETPLNGYVCSSSNLAWPRRSWIISSTSDVALYLSHARFHRHILQEHLPWVQLHPWISCGNHPGCLICAWSVHSRVFDMLDSEKRREEYMCVCDTAL